MGVLLGPAIVVALVSFAETYSVGKAISTGTKQKVDVNQEFIGQGLANLMGSFFQSYPVSGSFSRTAINFTSGAKTWSPACCHARRHHCAPILTLSSHTFQSGAFRPGDQRGDATVQPGQVFSLWKKNRHDGIVAFTVFALALLTKPDYALLIGVVLSLVLFLWKDHAPADRSDHQGP